MLDLNSKQFAGSTIFNNGNAGKVDNNTISVEKKAADAADTAPDYKLIVKDEAGNSINQAFWYPKADADEKKVNMELGRVIHIARAVVGADYEFPAVKTAKEAFDMLFKLVRDNAGDKKFSVFVTYGNKGFISKYLGLRYFNFIEPTELPSGTVTRLKVTPNDQMERIVEDAPKAGGSNEDVFSNESTSNESWV